MDAAELYIWNEFIGAVIWDDRTGYASFEFDKAFTLKGWDLSPIRMPIANKNRIYSFPELKAPRNSEFDTFKGLPGLLADALPDRYGSELIDIWLASQGRPPGSLNPVELLCFIGSRGMGAIEYRPAIRGEYATSESIDIENLVDTARRLLTKKEGFSTGFNPPTIGIESILRVGTSAGGARPKAVIAYNEQTGEVKSGQASAPEGFQHWLIKLDGISDIQLGSSSGYGRVEMAYYRMAMDAGIDMMPCRLLEEGDRAHFMTKRFDRHGGSTKHHIQTWCALEHFDYNRVTSFSYEQLFQTMRALRLDYAEAEQMFRRAVFNVVARNCDDHTKNFSFILKQGERWQLSPAYDICHAYNPTNRWVNQHALSINGKRKDFSKKDLVDLGNSIGCRKSQRILSDITEIVANWKTYAKEQEVSPSLTESIQETLLTSIT